MADFNARQRKFVKFYEGNATEAAIRAGYSKASAGTIGPHLMKDPDIVKAIQNRVRPIEDRAIASREERQRFWTRVMIDDHVEMKHRLKASELLGRSQADFITDSENINVNIKMGLVGLLKKIDGGSPVPLGRGEVIDIGSS